MGVLGSFLEGIKGIDNSISNQDEGGLNESIGVVLEVLNTHLAQSICIIERLILVKKARDSGKKSIIFELENPSILLGTPLEKARGNVQALEGVTKEVVQSSCAVPASKKKPVR